MFSVFIIQRHPRLEDEPNYFHSETCTAASAVSKQEKASKQARESKKARKKVRKCAQASTPWREQAISTTGTTAPLTSRNPPQTPEILVKLQTPRYRATRETTHPCMCFFRAHLPPKTKRSTHNKNGVIFGTIPLRRIASVFVRSFQSRKPAPKYVREDVLSCTIIILILYYNHTVRRQLTHPRQS